MKPFMTLITIALTCSTALASEPTFPAGASSLMLQDAAAGAGEQATPSADPEEAPSARPFGEGGSWYWGLQGGVAFTSDNTEYNGQVLFGTFLTDGFEFNFSLGGWHHDQEEDDAQSINPAFGFRYHFMPKDPFNVYIEAGIGLLFSNDDVPADGTSTNFTPRAGVGTLIRLDESSGLRLDLGVRWHHISNATTSGSDDNPSRDSIMVYTGIIFPF